MNILIVSPISIFPNTRGSTNRILSLARSLNKAKVNVFVLHAGSSIVTKDKITFFGYMSFGKLFKKSNMVSRFLDRTFCTFNIFMIVRLITLVQQINPDIIQFEFPTTIANPFIALLNIPKVLKILDEHNVESLTAKSSSSVPLLFPYKLAIERKAVKNADLILSVSNSDKKHLCHLYGLHDSRIVVIPNGVNMDEFQKYSKINARKKLGFTESEKVILFHGQMAWKPNREAVKLIMTYILPKVYSKYPNVMFLIIGEYSEILEKQYFNNTKNVHFLGFVKNLANYIAASDVCIVPLVRGGGTSLKILEYMAAGKPIVSTKIGVRGFKIREGKHAIIKDDIQKEFPNAIIKLLESPINMELLGNHARDLALIYDWKNIGKKLVEIYFLKTSYIN